MQTNLLLQEPFNKAVYQRDNSGSAFIPVVGSTTAGISTITATFTLQKVGDVQTLEYALPIVVTIPVNADGTFSGRAVVPGGWYSLTVSDGSTTVPVERIGSGEVFVLFGHSFMQGGHDVSHQLPSTDERVIALLDGLTNVENKFGQLIQKIGPFHDYPDAWGQLGDKLVKRLGVPVLFYGAAYGGSNILQNYQVINGNVRTSMPPGTTDITSRQPFLPLEDVFNNYVAKTGVRGILIEHGYNDRGETADVFAGMFRNVFDYVRTHWKKDKLALMLVQEQLAVIPGVQTLTDPVTAQGIKNLIDNYHDTYKGPDFNASYWPGLMTQHDHLFGAAIDQFATDWDNAINTNFLPTSTPYLSESGNVAATTVSNDIDAYNASTLPLKTIDWVILAGLAGLLILIFIRQSRGLMIGFLLLAALGLGRLTNKL